jgi:hypothetical protein
LPHQYDNFVLSTPAVLGSAERAPRIIPSNQQQKPEKIEVSVFSAAAKEALPP